MQRIRMIPSKFRRAARQATTRRFPVGWATHRKMTVAGSVELDHICKGNPLKRFKSLMFWMHEMSARFPLSSAGRAKPPLSAEVVSLFVPVWTIPTADVAFQVWSFAPSRPGGRSNCSSADRFGPAQWHHEIAHFNREG